MKPLFNSMIVKDRFSVVLSQNEPKIFRANYTALLIFGILFAGHTNLFAQPYPAPTFNAVSYSFCEGDDLVFTLDDLPDTIGFGNVVVNLTWYLSTSSNCGSSEVSDVVSDTISSTSHTFNTGHTLSSLENNGLFMITASIFDPLDIVDGQEIILAQTTCIPIAVNPPPVGIIAPTGGGVAAICEGNTYQVDFTATVGTGPYDVVINGFTFSGVLSGGTIDLMEGIHFTGSAANIELTSITDTGVMSNCTTTGAPITTLLSPPVNTFVPREMLTADEIICANSTPASITGPMPTVTGGTSVSYGWESSLDNGSNWVLIVGEADTSYSPGALTQDMWYRRIDTFNTAGVLCWVPIDTVEVMVNNITISNTLSEDEVVCEGETPMMITGNLATMDGTPTYGWESSVDSGIIWDPIGLATDMSYSPPAPITMHTWYRRVDTSEFNGVKCFQIVDTVKVFLNNFITVGGITMADTTICSNVTPAPIMGTMSVGTGAGVGVGATYGWQLREDTGISWVDIPLETDSNYTPSLPIFTDTWYRRIDTISFMGTQCVMVVDTIKYIVNNITTKGTLSEDQSLCAGDAPSMITELTASIVDGMISYAWQDSTIGSSFTTIIGANSATYTPPVLTEDTWYRRIDSTDLGGMKCWMVVDTVRITVNNLTVSNVLSGDQTICVDSLPNPITGTPSTADGNQTYGWESSVDSGMIWTVIPGATDTSYTPLSSIAKHTWFRRIDTSEVNGVKCFVEIDTVKVLLNDFTFLGGLNNPDEVICEGDTATAITGTMSTGGDLVVTYGWEETTDNGMSWNLIPSQTGMGYTPTVSLISDIWYRRIDTTSLNGVKCSHTSDTVKVIVNKFDSIGHFITVDETICVGEQPSIILGYPSAAVGNETYGWQLSIDSATWTTINLATSIFYVPPGGIFTTTWYRRVDTSTLGSNQCIAFVDTVKVTVNNFDALGALTNPDTTICSGDTPFEIEGLASTGTGNITYGWESSIDSGSNWLPIMGETTIDYQAGSLTTDTWYRRIDTITLAGVSCEVIVDTVKIAVNSFIALGTMAANETICEGATPSTITGTASMVDGVISHGWQSSTAGAGVGFAPIANATGLTYSPPVLTQDTWYRRIDTTTLGTSQCIEIIGPIKITVNNITIDTLLSIDQIICEDEIPNPITGIPSNSDGTLTYSWESTVDSGMIWTPIVGAIDTSYTPVLSINTNTWYRRIDTSNLSGFKCALPMDTVVVNVNPKPDPVIAGMITEICVGNGIYLPFTVSGIGTYTDTTWLTSDISRATVTADGLITAIASGFSNISVVVTDTNGCKDTSNTHAVIILPLPVAGAITGMNQVCMGDSITLTATPTGGNGGNTISWTVLNGTGSATISTAGVLQPMSAGTVDVSYAVADNKTCTAVSAFFTVTIDTIPTPVIIANDTTICQGDMVEFTASGGTAYEFLVNNISLQGPAVFDTFVTNTLNHNDMVRVVVANSTGCFDTSSVITMMVDTIPMASLVSDAFNNAKGIGQAVIFTANGGTNYEFFVNNVSQGMASATAIFTTSTLSHLDTVMVNVADGNTCSDTAMIVMTINGRPIAINDTITLLEDALFDTIDVQANDTDPEGDLLTTIIVNGAMHGVSATVNDSTIQYMPDPDFNGLDSITYWVCDDFNNCDAAKIYITVQSVNDIPMANSDTLRITEDDPTTLIEVLANDIDADGDSLNVIILTIASKGFATVIPDSTVAYTPMPDSSGIDVIAYKVCDTKDSCSVGIIFIEIMPINDRPEAVKDSITIQEDSMNVRVLILANDTDADNDVITIDTVYPPTSGGTILVSNDTVVYNPPANFNGLDSIKYAICDTALCDTTYLIINVLPVNEAPIAVNDTVTIPEDTSTIKIAFLANDLEVDGETIIIDSLFSAALGTTTVVNDTLCYTPLANANGIDSLKYIITDGLFKDSAYILINILSINDAPIAVNDTVTVPENANPAVILVQINDSDPDGDLFATGLVSGPTNGSAFAGGGSILYTPSPAFNGLDTITYRICDAQIPQQCDTATIFITVSGINDPPLARNDTICIGEDTATVAIAIELNDFDLDGDATSISILIGANHAAIDSIRNDSLIYQPTANFNGIDSVQYQLFDGSLVDQAWVYIITKPRNDAPITVADTLIILEDMANVQIAVTANDSDVDVGDTLIVTVLTPPISGGTATVMNDTTLVYTPGLNFFGLDTIIYQACDTSNACATDTVFITVQSVNEPPIAVDDFLTINEDASSVVIDVQANDSDGDGDAFTTTIISTPMMADTLNGDSIMVTAPTDFTGVQVIVYKICDALGLCDTANVTITLLPINDGPIANLDNVVIPQDTTDVGIAPLANDTDIDDVTLTITTISTTTTAGGMASIIGIDSIKYTPLAGFNGIDTIHYTVCDTSNLCDNGIIIVTIGFVNTPPNAVNDTLMGIAEDSGPVAINVLMNDSDIDGLADSLKLMTITTPANGGTVTVTGDSIINYTPPLNFNGIDSLQYTVCDTSMGCASAWVFFMVTSVNDAPYAVNDTVFLSKDTIGTQIVVLTNDSDIDGDVLTVSTIGNSTQGVMTTVAGNLIVYSAPIGFLGADTITYKVTDVGGLMDTAFLIIIITDPNNAPPRANPDFATTIPTIAVNIDVQDNDLEPNGDNLITTIIGGPKAGNTATVLNQDSIQYTSAITFAGYDTIWYQVCDPSLTCDTSIVIITVENTLAISARVILEGAYDRTTLLMHDSLRELNFLPVIEPYSTWPRLAGAYEFAHKNGGGNEIITNPGTVLGVTGPNAIVDWVYLELLTTTDTIPVASRSALIQRDGDIVDIDGVSPVAFERLPSGNYFLSIRHRNHLGVMTKTAQPFSQNAFTTLDFTVQGAGSTPAFGTNAMDTVQSRLVLWAGDGNADRKIIYDGIANDRDPVFFDVITDPLNINSNYNHVTFGYYRGDYDMKGSSVYLGGGNDPDVIFFNVFLHPNNAVGSTIFIIREQIPR